MRQTYSTIYNKFLRNIESVGTSDQNIIDEFNYQLGVNYQLMLAKLSNFKTYLTSSFSTTAGGQYYAYPPGYVNTDGLVVTVGSVNFPLKVVNSEYLWEVLNSITVQASVLPQYYYPRRDDFGIWPVPQATYTGNIYYHYRDRNLMTADYAAGTVAVTNSSTTVVGTGTSFTSAMVGRWFTIDDTTVPGRGYFYRVVAVTDSTHLTLFQNWVGSTSSGVSSYRIGESPEIPEDLHMYLVDGVTGGFYKDYRHDAPSSVPYFNSFWTGDPSNPNRKIGDTDVAGGLIGGINAYEDRDDDPIIDRNPKLSPLTMKIWATSIT